MAGLSLIVDIGSRRHQPPFMDSSPVTSPSTRSKNRKRRGAHSGLQHATCSTHYHHLPRLPHLSSLPPRHPLAIACPPPGDKRHRRRRPRREPMMRGAAHQRDEAPGPSCTYRGRRPQRGKAARFFRLKKTRGSRRERRPVAAPRPPRRALSPTAGHGFTQAQQASRNRLPQGGRRRCTVPYPAAALSGRSKKHLM